MSFSLPNWIWLTVLATVVVVVGIVGETAYVEHRSLQPPRVPAQPLHPALSGLTLEEVSIAAPDGVRLSGWYVPSRNGAAIALFHGYAGERQQLALEAGALARHGYGVLLLDSRAHGQSGGVVTTHGDRERGDVRATLDFLASTVGASAPLGLFGFSAGAVPLPAVAAEDPRVRAVVLAGCSTSAADFSRDESGRLSWLKAPVILAVMRANGIDPDVIDALAAVPRLSPRALLIIHGEEDSIVPVVRARSLFAAAGEPKRIHVFPTAGHGGYGEVEPTYPKLLTDFFDRYLLGGDPDDRSGDRSGDRPSSGSSEDVGAHPVERAVERPVAGPPTAPDTTAGTD